MNLFAPTVSLRLQHRSESHGTSSARRAGVLEGIKLFDSSFCTQDSVRKLEVGDRVIDMFHTLYYWQ